MEGKNSRMEEIYWESVKHSRLTMYLSWEDGKDNMGERMAGYCLVLEIIFEDV